MKTIIIQNKGLNESNFKAAFVRLQDYTAYCYLSDDESHIAVHCDPAPMYSVDSGSIMNGVAAAKLAIRYYLKSYLREIEIVVKE